MKVTLSELRLVVSVALIEETPPELGREIWEGSVICSEPLRGIGSVVWNLN